MLRAYLLDLWLFVRKVAPNAAAILVVLLGAACIFYATSAWPGADFLDCCIRAIYMMKVESVEAPEEWSLKLFVILLPVAGVVLALDAVVRATVLFINKSLRQGEWNAVIASTYRGHTLVCGLGQFGATVCSGLVDAGRRVVGIDLDESLPTVVTARRRNVPVIIGDMTLPETLHDANVRNACCVIVCSGDDLANIEAAIAASEMNDAARVYARVYKKTLADRISQALRFDIRTFSPDDAAARSILTEIHRQDENAAVAGLE